MAQGPAFSRTVLLGRTVIGSGSHLELGTSQIDDLTGKKAMSTDMYKYTSV